jgi:hypothetical protein
MAKRARKRKKSASIVKKNIESEYQRITKKKERMKAYESNVSGVAKMAGSESYPSNGGEECGNENHGARKSAWQYGGVKSAW